MFLLSASGFPVTIKFQPATCNLQPATCNLQPATCNLQPAKYTCRRKAVGKNDIQIYA